MWSYQWLPIEAMAYAAIGGALTIQCVCIMLFGNTLSSLCKTRFFIYRMTKVREFRETAENLLLLDGGDQYQGTFWFFVFQGQATAFFTKHIGYDAMVCSKSHENHRIFVWLVQFYRTLNQALGNHEFDIGLENLQEFVTDVSSTFDVLSANIDNSNEPGLTGYKKYVIKDVNGRKIAIIGYTTSDTPILTSAGNHLSQT